MHPELIRIGSFALPTYGLMMAVAFLAALWLLRRRAPSFGIEAETASDIGVWLLLSGLLGSKLLLVIVEWPSYVRSWKDFASLARAGGVFYGGLIGAVLATVDPAAPEAHPVLDVRGRRGAVRGAGAGVRAGRLLPRRLLLGPGMRAPVGRHVHESRRARERRRASRRPAPPDAGLRGPRDARPLRPPRALRAPRVLGRDLRPLRRRLRPAARHDRVLPRRPARRGLRRDVDVAVHRALRRLRGARDLRRSDAGPRPCRSRRERTAAAGPGDPRGPGGRRRAPRPRPPAPSDGPARGLAHEDPAVDRRGMCFDRGTETEEDFREGEEGRSHRGLSRLRPLPGLPSSPRTCLSRSFSRTPKSSSWTSPRASSSTPPSATGTERS